MVARIPGVAGPANFQRRLAAGLAKRGINTCYNLDDSPYDGILVIGGTRRLVKLRQAYRRGVPIIQRLNGINWIHRIRRTGYQHFLRAELNNWLLRTIRNHIADHVVYQSHFARDWWERVYGPAPIPSSVVHNAVPLDQYSPIEPDKRPKDLARLLVVEGNLSGGYEIGLESAVGLARRLQDEFGLPVELAIAARVDPGLQDYWDKSAGVPLNWLGLVAPEEIPAIDRSAHLLYASDINPACPNAVIEAMACGLPVVAFDTGALPELVDEKAGKIIPYGGDPWRLDPPDIVGLADAALEVIADQTKYRSGARTRAEAIFGLEDMIDGYLRALGWS
jgi:glycosyltransferase involved in cell wall biosynthesis